MKKGCLLTIVIFVLWANGSLAYSLVQPIGFLEDTFIEKGVFGAEFKEIQKKIITGEKASHLDFKIALRGRRGRGIRLGRHGHNRKTKFRRIYIPKTQIRKTTIRKASLSRARNFRILQSNILRRNDLKNSLILRRKNFYRNLSLRKENLKRRLRGEK